MQNNRTDLAERLLDFAAAVIELSPRIGKTITGRYLCGQLVRACSSAGANYQEARGAESRADFVHKMQVVLKELRESEYWLRLIGRSRLVPGDMLGQPLREADELIRIVVKSVVTAKSRS